jgi:hypothetical protein
MKLRWVKHNHSLETSTPKGTGYVLMVSTEDIPLAYYVLGVSTGEPALAYVRLANKGKVWANRTFPSAGTAKRWVRNQLI